MKVANVEILKRIPAFSQLKEADIQEISKITIERSFRKGAIIFMEGDPGEAFYFIKSGKVKVYKTTPDGREHIFTILSEGGVFAEVTLFNEIPYPASAEVLEDAEIGMIKNKELEDLIRRNAEIALQIIKVFSKKLFSSQQKVKELALGDTYMRIAKTLITFAEDHGVKTSNGIEIRLNISRQELANMIGTARETVSRALSQFKKEGSIDIEGKKIIIKNMEKLESWV
ncbi:CRP/FNR family transcriptional regulator, anaerobic regulatory protein [Anaerovirgula multivorans]|uniref:CRP/FNR family transcriptional regulator, anaerobic regulatory protein n=1 Tax=Anaerovirgula multivorans TaxID=312168 RepID=A0A239ATE5_9FIRM|nr:Crp/Fnr family transcriptional regulator [Anaerovirgula multivorans]SNR98975.1 CRP/FNR family transcriptional regulator, anaerobic regulatory protein [Anaerovirgula multivorans]